MNIRKKINLVEIGLVSLFIVIYSLAASSVSLNRYWQYDAFWYDFGIFDTTIWKLSRFQLPVIAHLLPPTGKIVWADHFNPSAVLLVSFYWLTDKQEIIFIAQAIFVGLSAFIAYLITRKTVENTIVRISLIISYLGFVGLQNALYTDVHNIVFALLPFMLAIWAVYQKKWKIYWIFLLITIGFQENMAAVAAMFGLFLILRKDRNIKVGVITVCLGILYGVMAMKVIIPAFNSGYYSYQPAIPKVWYEWFTQFFIPVDMKLRTIVLTFVTFGFLPIGSIAALPLIIGHYLERFVLNTAATRWDLGFHYNALLSPIMFLASLEVIIHLQGQKIIKKILPYWGMATILISRIPRSSASGSTLV